jgi:hypothetical protein
MWVSLLLLLVVAAMSRMSPKAPRIWDLIRSRHWPSVTARYRGVTFRYSSFQRRFARITVDVTYVVDGQTNTGGYKWNFLSDAGAQRMQKRLGSGPVSVRYKPSNPNRFVVMAPLLRPDAPTTPESHMGG